MKLIIDISQNDYEEIKEYGINTFPSVARAIQNGTPLPEGHGRLIEVSKELECELWTYTRYTGIDESPYEDATNALELAPTIIEADMPKEGEAE